MFLTKRLAINKRYLDPHSMAKNNSQSVDFCYNKKVIFAIALGAWWNW
ncbi:hypothetical protein [Prochlorococcus sp. MIT 0604]|nr:hypothetical protein [Prochlorococcus sp. MIT 0604]